jgi:hypothetical protein
MTNKENKPDLELQNEIAKIDVIDYDSEQVRTQQREGALAIADLIAEYELDKSFNNKPLQALVLVRMQDLQVRDYAMGVIQTERLEFFIQLWQALFEIAPTGFKAGPATILAALYYENCDLINANKSLNSAIIENPEYGLAKLLIRVFAAKWPSNSFARMRKELHPKVCEYLFGSTMAS